MLQIGLWAVLALSSVGVLAGTPARYQSPRSREVVPGALLRHWGLLNAKQFALLLPSLYPLFP